MAKYEIGKNYYYKSIKKNSVFSPLGELLSIDLVYESTHITDAYLSFKGGEFVYIQYITGTFEEINEKCLFTEEEYKIIKKGETMKIYDFRAYAISEIVEMVKGYRDCKIILNSWQEKKLPPTFFNFVAIRGISIEVDFEYPTINYVPSLTFKNVQPLITSWSNAEDWTITTSIGSNNSNLSSIDYSSFQPSLPHSVNFVEKHKRTTLVWKNVFGKFETTKSEAHDEKFDYLYGFLMAYFKRVHRDKSKTQLKKYLNAIVYPMTKKEQTAFLQGVFYENCGLGFKEAKKYLEKIKVKK